MESVSFNGTIQRHRKQWQLLPQWLFWRRWVFKINPQMIRMDLVYSRPLSQMTGAFKKVKQNHTEQVNHKTNQNCFIIINFA